MKRKVTKKQKRRLVLIVVLAIGLFSVLLKTVLDDWIDIFGKQNEIEALDIKYQALLQEEAELQSEVKKLQDSDYVARYARETYLYSLPGEIIIKTK